MAISGGDGSIVLTTKVDETGLKKGLGSMKKLSATAGKAFLAIGAAAATATVAITKMAVSAYADYEQLVGGVETLFKDSAGKVLEYANQAFQTAGVSANEYMQQVTSFSASLLSSLAGDTDKAADVANMALIDISDNANKMGSSLESVTLAYQGFAKGQYMLLDNLKLGYGGTKTEMERLLKDAEAYLATQGKTAKFSINNLADVYTAINAIQQKLDIAGTTMNEAETTITGSLGMVKSSWQNLLTAMSGGGDLDRAINNFVYSLEKFTANIVPVIERTLLGLGQAIQRTLPMLVQTVVSALVQQIPNLVMAVYNMIVGLFKGIVLGIKALFTGGTANATEVIKGNVSGISSSASSAADNMNDVADATKKAGKEAKKSLAAFDELNILSSGGASAEKTPETSMPTISAGSDMPEIKSGGDILSGMTQTIKENLEYLLPTIEIALVAIGLILLAMGNIPWGLGFIIGGAYLYSVTERSQGTFDFQVILEDLKTLVNNIEEILISIGIILLFFGQIGFGIGFILAGAVVYAVKEVQAEEYDTADITTKLAVIMESVSLSLIGIGVMLILFGHVALGLGFIYVGKKLLDVQEQKLDEAGVTTKLQQFMADNSSLIVGVGLALVVIGVICICCGLLTPLTFGILIAGASVLATEETLNPGAIQQEITKFLTENAGLIVGVSLALLIIGIVLCACGIVTPFSIGLIVVGAAGLAAEVALNWNYIATSITNFIKDNSGLIVGVSLALIVLGIILLFTGVGIPLAIGLIVAGGGALAATVALNWNFIVDKVKEVWEKVKQFWNENIAPIFTAQWWADLGKKAINGLLGVIEKGLNWIIDKINEFVSGLSRIVGAVGDVIGVDWNIPKIPKVTIPRLAQGAVIPPNREFLAVLGDQKHGTNIEAPLDTIVEAMNIALQNNGAGQTTKEEHYYLGETELMSIIYKLVKGGERLQGNSLISSGGVY